MPKSTPELIIRKLNQRPSRRSTRRRFNSGLAPSQPRSLRLSAAHRNICGGLCRAKSKNGPFRSRPVARSLIDTSCVVTKHNQVDSPPRPVAFYPSDVVMLNGVALARHIAARQLSCVEVMTAYLDHIERLNPRVNAIVALRDAQPAAASAANTMCSLRAASSWGRCTAFHSR